MGCRPPGSSVHGILQARVVEWVAMPYRQWEACKSLKEGSNRIRSDFLKEEAAGGVEGGFSKKAGGWEGSTEPLTGVPPP